MSNIAVEQGSTSFFSKSTKKYVGVAASDFVKA